MKYALHQPSSLQDTTTITEMVVSEKAKIEEIQDVVDVVNSDGHADSGSDGESEHELGGDDAERAGDGVDTPGAGSSSQSKKKKKKKRKTAAKLLGALNPSNKNLPQPLVDAVMEKMREEHGEGAAGADEETVRKALEQLKVMDVIKGKAGIGGRGKKDTGGHKVSITRPIYLQFDLINVYKFWDTQPVPKLGNSTKIFKVHLLLDMNYLLKVRDHPPRRATSNPRCLGNKFVKSHTRYLTSLCGPLWTSGTTKRQAEYYTYIISRVISETLPDKRSL